MEQLELEIQKPDAVKPERKKETFTRHCEECGNEYAAVYKTSRFCSDKCRCLNGRKKIKQTTTMTTSPVTKKDDDGKETQHSKLPSSPIVASPIFQGLSPQMAIAVDLLKQDSRRWEDLYKEEREKRKKMQGKYEETKDELVKLKVDHRIESIENAKPSGLQGFAENPLILKLVEHVGPALGALMMKFTDGPTQGQLVGTDGQLDEVAQGQMNDIIKWMSELPAETRGVLYEVLHQLAQSKTIVILNDTLMRMRNILKAGTVIIPHQGYGTM